MYVYFYFRINSANLQPPRSNAHELHYNPNSSYDPPPYVPYVLPTHVAPTTSNTRARPPPPIVIITSDPSAMSATAPPTGSLGRTLRTPRSAAVVQADIDETVSVMRANIAMMTQRGESLEDLESRTGTLSCLFLSSPPPPLESRPHLLVCCRDTCAVCTRIPTVGE